MEKKMFAIHTMYVDYANDVYDLGAVKLFPSLEKAKNERDAIIEELRADYEFEKIWNSWDELFNTYTTIIEIPNLKYEIRIEEIKIDF